MVEGGEYKESFAVGGVVTQHSAAPAPLLHAGSYTSSLHDYLAIVLKLPEVTQYLPFCGKLVNRLARAAECWNEIKTGVLVEITVKQIIPM